MKKTDLLLRLTLCPHVNAKFHGQYVETIVTRKDADLTEDEFIDRFIRPMVFQILDRIGT
jgi:hypothetical protein